MKTIFDYDDYKTYVRDRLRVMPKKGRGQLRRLSEHLQVSTVLISQIFSGDRDLTPEQAFDTTVFLNLNETQTQYFQLLVQKERAGTHRLRAELAKQIEVLRKKGRSLKSVLPVDRDLSDQEKAIFYSSWQYSGVRVLSSIENFQTVDSIAERLDLPREVVARIVNFLVTSGLCVETNGRIQAGPRRTHLEAGSALVRARQIGWRIKGFESMDRARETDLFYTAPMSVSSDSIGKIRSELAQTIERVVKIVGEEKPTEAACLNIDWFKF